MSDRLQDLWRSDETTPPGRAAFLDAAGVKRLDTTRRRLAAWTATAQVVGLVAALWVDLTGVSPLPGLLTVLCLVGFLSGWAKRRAEARRSAALAVSGPAEALEQAIAAARRNRQGARWLAAFPPAMAAGVGLAWLMDGAPAPSFSLTPWDLVLLVAGLTFSAAVGVRGWLASRAAGRELAALEGRAQEIRGDL